MANCDIKFENKVSKFENREYLKEVKIFQESRNAGLNKIKK